MPRYKVEKVTMYDVIDTRAPEGAQEIKLNTRDKKDADKMAKDLEALDGDTAPPPEE